MVSASAADNSRDVLIMMITTTQRCGEEDASLETVMCHSNMHCFNYLLYL